MSFELEFVDSPTSTVSFELKFVDYPTSTAEFAAAYTGATGAGVTFSGAVDTVDQLPTTGITGDLYAVLSKGVGYIWGDSGWTNIGPILGPKGDKGDKGDSGDPADPSLFFQVSNRFYEIAEDEVAKQAARANLGLATIDGGTFN